jgi:hypothetical protein
MKVICISQSYPPPDITIGKAYEMVDGINPKIIQIKEIN